ncbi:hypothetical protein [Allofournierella sp.]|uniref:hypothetical protein n=1 Tax=Allofournierella sp. TaxID=1940256 RepID=UPI003AB8261D
MAVMDIVAVQYEARMEPGVFGGREYTYFAEVPLQMGDVVHVPTKFGSSLARVVRVGIPEYRVDDKVKQIMRHITNKPVPAPAPQPKEEGPIQLKMGGT